MYESFGPPVPPTSFTVIHLGMFWGLAPRHQSVSHDTIRTVALTRYLHRPRPPPARPARPTRAAAAPPRPRPRRRRPVPAHALMRSVLKLPVTAAC